MRGHRPHRPGQGRDYTQFARCGNGVDRGAAGAGLSLLAQSPMWDAGPRHSRKEAVRAMQTDKEIP